MTQTRIRAVLFDMDGTLVDTLPDIAAAVNTALVELGLHTLDPAYIAKLIGNGPRILSRRALEAQESLTADQREQLVESLLEGYARNYAVQAGKLGRVFPGTLEGLSELSAAGYRLGVVTNALQHLAETVLTRFGITPYLQIVVGGDRVVRHKPHPEPLWQACSALDVAPARNPDGRRFDQRRVLPRAAAGCEVVCVPHGYDQGQPVTELGCDVVAALTALPAWIAARERRAPEFVVSAT